MKYHLRPNASLLMLVLILVAVWYAARSHNNNAAYVLGFLMISLAGLSVFQNFLMLRRVHIRAGNLSRTFAGGPGVLELMVVNQWNRDAAGIQITAGSWSTSPATVPPLGPGEEAKVRMEVAGLVRGRVHIDTLQARSLYPLGLFEGRRRLDFAVEGLVYPKPSGDRNFPESGSLGSRSEGSAGRGGDDFAGVRGYVAGESQRHIDWKAVARGQPLMVKQFLGGGEERLDFSWDDLPHLQPEARLSQICLWVLEAERAGLSYRVMLPNWSSPTDAGTLHQRQCLRALALYPETP